MTADLQLRPLLRLPAIRIRLTRSSVPASIPPPIHGSDDVVCQTPTSPQNKIPALLTCPPAPKKSRPVTTFNCKRKLDFFEIKGRDEIESFFKESFEALQGKKIKRN